MNRHSLTATNIAKIAGVSERTVDRWLDQGAMPVPVLRLLKICLGEARPEEYYP